MKISPARDFNFMTILYEFEGWVITDTYMITHGCMKRRARQMEPRPSKLKTLEVTLKGVCSWYCPSCTLWMPTHVAERLVQVKKLINPE